MHSAELGREMVKLIAKACTVDGDTQEYSE